MEEENKTRLTFINTNARSLCLKIGSLIHCFEEMQVSFGVITETWLTDGDPLLQDVEDLEYGAGLGMIYRNRPANSRGFSHGGVALIYRKSVMNFKQIDIGNTENYEVLGAIGNLFGLSRKVLVLAVYMPPNYSATRGKECLSYLTDLVLHLKSKYKDPMLYISGDFNQWDLTGAMEDYPDLQEAPVGPTRGNREIDRTFTNISEHLERRSVLPPLESDDSSKASDHRIALLEAGIPRKEAYELLRYTYQLYTEERAEEFGKLILGHDWGEVLEVEGSNGKAMAYQRHLDCAMDTFFPYVTTVRKSTEPP